MSQSRITIRYIKTQREKRIRKILKQRNNFQQKKIHTKLQSTDVFLTCSFLYGHEHCVYRYKGTLQFSEAMNKVFQVGTTCRFRKTFIK